MEAPGVAAQQVFPERRVLVDVEPGAHVLEQRELLEEPDLLEGARDAQAHALVGRHADERPVFQMQGSGVGLVDARQQVEERRLAGPVGPDQREDRFFRHRDRDVLHRAHAAEAFAEAFRPDHENLDLRASHACTMPPGMNSTTSVSARP